MTRSSPTTGDSLAMSTWRSASASGPVLLEIQGIGSADEIQRITQIMPTPRGRPIARYTTDPDAAGTPNTRVVLAFGASQTQAEAAPCAGAVAASGSTGSVSATLCSGSKMVRAAFVSTPAGSAENLEDVLRAAINDLVPRRDRERGDDDNCFLRDC
ncbi:MAG: hypothetical protein ACPGOY_18610 [Rhodospirillaceae bacterium]